MGQTDRQTFQQLKQTPTNNRTLPRLRKGYRSEVPRRGWKGIVPLYLRSVSLPIIIIKKEKKRKKRKETNFLTGGSFSIGRHRGLCRRRRRSDGGGTRV